MRMNFPKREELLFLTVCALPKASRIGLARRICSDRLVRFFAPVFARGVSELATAARYWMTFLVFSVFPAPDSPLCSVSNMSEARVGTHTSQGCFGWCPRLQGFERPHLPWRRYAALSPLVLALGTY